MESLTPFIRRQLEDAPGPSSPPEAAGSRVSPALGQPPSTEPPKPGCGSQHLLRPLVRASHPAGRGPNSDSLFPPLAAVVVVAPIEERPWQFVKLYLLARGSPR